jgi:flagellar hook-associated protein 1 FlgK
MGTGFINTGVTGLRVAQMGLQTASHNITNANTSGFNRQRIVQSSNMAQLTGSGFIGQGANVSTIERMYSGFLTAQVNTAQTQVSELDSYYSQVSQIDNMLADANSGLSSALQDFFTGVQQVAASPSQLPARQAMVSSAQALVSRFQSLGDQLSEMSDGVNSEITATVSSINSYAKQIGVLNQQIIVAESSISQPSNDLLDQRDQLVAELNKLVKVSTTTNTDGSFNVFVGTGQQLVVGTLVSTMTATPSSADPTRLTVGLKTAGGSLELPESLISGGSLGGLLRFRSESLDRVANDLGRSAASLALTFNAQNALGQDLLGNIAGSTGFQSDFFVVDPSPLSAKIVPNANNTSSAVLTATLNDASSNGTNFYTNLTASDYRVAYDGTNYSVTRLSDNHVWPNAAEPAALVPGSAFVLAGEGISINLSGAMNAGDSFLIEPTRDVARNLKVNPAIVADARLIAAAAPIRTQAAAGNTGSAAITAGSVAAGYDVSAVPFTLTYDSSTSELTGSFPGAPIAYTSGDTISVSGISFQISGTPNDNDSFTISLNSAGSADGRNALALGKLQTQNTMSGQTATYQSAYAQLVSDNGNKTRELKVTAAAQQSLLDQSTSARESLSGVNLDEEAANLIRYQQAYQASAKIIDIGSKLFDVLLAINA